MGAEQNNRPLASIIIDNYNYGQYLRAAIDSALAQTYPRTEVIVVDDGSTDDSRQIISAYGVRILPVLKENGGQSSAFNAGFAASKGDMICLLDSDDVFSPDKVAEVMQARAEHPDASVIYHQLQGIDAHGLLLWNGKPWPRIPRSGNIKEDVEQSGGWWLWPNTSGLCFPRSFLERVMPAPTEAFRICADTYLASIAPYLGPVVGIPRPLTQYRMHGRNWVMQFSEKQRSVEGRAMVRNYSAWFTIIIQTLRERLGVPTAVSLNDHYLYQIHRRNAGEAVPLWAVLFTIARCPLLPLTTKMKEALKVARNRR